jgi:hypothetical protein
MALPTLNKTWIFKTNVLLPSTGNYQIDFRRLLLTIKHLLATSAGWTDGTGSPTTNSNPWTVRASSNSTVANTNDNWAASFQGTDTNANVDTSGGNNVLMIRSSPLPSYSIFTVTSGASVAKTTIVSDLNGNSSFTNLGLTASITGTNQLTISDSTGLNAYIQIESIANGSTLGTPCGFTSGGMSTTNNLVWGTNYSWVVLRQSQINPTFEICLATSSSATYYLANTFVSHSSGFTLTGLLTTAVPTASDRITHLNDGYIVGLSTNTAFDAVLNVAMSTDGQCTRIWCYRWGNLRTFWLFDKPKNPVSGWTNPSICLMQHNSGSLIPSAYTELTDNALISARAKNQNIWLYVTTEFYISAAIGESQTTPNQLSGEWPMTPCGLVSATPGVYGRHGEIYDLWYTSTDIQPNCSIPSTGNRLFIVLPQLVHTWNRSNPVPA